MSYSENASIDNKARQKVWDLIKDIRIAQLVTHAENNKLAARPMHAIGQDFFDGELWFFTTSDTPKIQEIENNPHVLLSYSEPSKNEYVSLQGEAHISNDRAEIRELWSEAARAWFPEGAEDPRLRLVKVQVTSAEYWDSPASKLVMIYGYAVAKLTGETPKVGENKKVQFS